MNNNENHASNSSAISGIAAYTGEFDNLVKKRRRKRNEEMLCAQGFYFQGYG
jgi:hypothetical protein